MAGPVVNRDGAKEEFDEGKIWNSIFYACRESEYPEEEAVEIADRVKKRVIEWMEHHEDCFVTTREIRRRVIEELEEEDEDVSFMYETHLDLS